MKYYVLMISILISNLSIAEVIPSEIHPENDLATQNDALSEVVNSFYYIKDYASSDIDGPKQPRLFSLSPNDLQDLPYVVRLSVWRNSYDYDRPLDVNVKELTANEDTYAEAAANIQGLVEHENATDALQRYLNDSRLLSSEENVQVFWVEQINTYASCNGLVIVDESHLEMVHLLSCLSK